MGRNPYLAVQAVRRGHRRRAEPWQGRVARWLLPVIGAAVLVPLVRPVFLGFLDGAPELWGAGLEGVTLRFGFAMVGWLSLDVYTALIRGPDRAVLDLHPVDPAAVVVADVVRVARTRWWLLGIGALLLLPVGLAGSWLGWSLGVGVLAGAWALGLSSSAMVHLLAVLVADNPRFGAVLDLFRGQNPRPQAAFIYAPGVVLSLAGALVMLSATGARQVLEGDWVGLVWMCGLPVAAVAAWLPVGALSAGSWFRASAVLADIDARYGALVDKEEGRRVYLDWAVRFLPGRWAHYALKDLRHGWRARRTWITGAWLVGIAGALVGWTSGEHAADWAAAMASAGSLAAATIALLMERDEPAFMRVWLPPGGVARWGARLVVVWAWLLGCTLPAVASVLLRHGTSEALVVGAAGLGSAVFAAVLSTACSRLPERGLAVYGPCAAVVATAVAASLLSTGG